LVAKARGRELRLMSNASSGIEKKLDVLAIGNLTVDQIITVDKLPRIHFESNILKNQTSFGGRAPNVSVMLARMGFRTGIVSPVGKDFRCSGHLDHLLSYGVDIRGIVEIPDEDTMKTVIVTAQNGEQITFLETGAARHFESMPLPMDLIEDTKIVHISSSCNCQFNILAAQKAKELGAIVSFDVGNDPASQEREYQQEMLESVNMLFANDVEIVRILEMLGRSSPADLLDSRSRIVVVIAKRDKASTIYSSREIVKIPSLMRRVLDPTGTSDAYVAGFLAGHLKNFGISSCGMLGAAESGFIAETVGCQTNMPTWEMIKFRAGVCEGQQILAL